MGGVLLERLAPFAPAGLGELAIETGTCKGYGAQALSRAFPRVITIELGEELHRLARDRLAVHSNVECLLGSSPERLAQILPLLPPESTTFFFLDAHWSGDSTVAWSDSKWKGYGHDTAHLGTAGRPPTGPEQCPLAEELAVIARHCRGRAHILIDDTGAIGRRGVGFPGEDWAHLSRELIAAIPGARLEDFRELEKPSQWFLRLSPTVAG